MIKFKISNSRFNGEESKGNVMLLTASYKILILIAIRIFVHLALW